MHICCIISHSKWGTRFDFKHRTSLKNFDLNTLQNSNTNIFLGRLTIVYAYEPVYSVRQVVRNLFLNLEYATTVQWASGLIYCCAEVSVSISAPLKDDCGAKQWFQNWKNPPEIDSLLQFVCCDFTKKFKATFSISFSGGYLLFVFKICQTVAVICMIWHFLLQFLAGFYYLAQLWRQPVAIGAKHYWISMLCHG